MIRLPIDTQGLARRRVSARVSLTPLIDVVFILLVFFMLETDFLKPRAVELAHAASQGTGVAEQAPIYLEAHADGSLWINGAEIAFDGLRAAIQELAPGPETQVVIGTDPGVRLQRVVDIVDLVNRLGLTRVSLREAPRFD